MIVLLALRINVHYTGHSHSPNTQSTWTSVLLKTSDDDKYKNNQWA